MRKAPLPKFPWKSLFTNYIIHNSTLSPAVFAENGLNHTPISMRIFWCAWQPGMSYYMVRFTTSFGCLLNIRNYKIIYYFEKIMWDFQNIYSLFVRSVIKYMFYIFIFFICVSMYFDIYERYVAFFLGAGQPPTFY